MGWERQQTGDAGEKVVESTLTRSGYATGVLDPDLGEDLWIEADGRRASAEGSFPYRALVQVKSSRQADGDTFLHDLELEHIRRWAAQPLPVFVIGVDLAGERFFAKLVDDIIAEELGGQDVMQRTGRTIRVRLPVSTSLGVDLRVRMEGFYRSSQLVLANLDQHRIEQDHFEIVKREPSEPWARFCGWSVIWKSAQRPQYLAAVLTELARQATHDRAVGPLRPDFFVFHLYRSLFDLQHNIATVRVDWVDPSHPGASKTNRILGAPGGFRWRVEKGIESRREFHRARTINARDYVEYGTEVGTVLDEITELLISRPVLEGWNAPLVARFKEVDKLWNEGPDAPVECAQLEKMITAHHQAVDGSYHVANHRRDALPQQTVERLLRESIERMRECHRAWRVIARM